MTTNNVALAPNGAQLFVIESENETVNIFELAGSGVEISLHSDDDEQLAITEAASVLEDMTKTLATVKGISFAITFNKELKRLFLIGMVDMGGGKYDAEKIDIDFHNVSTIRLFLNNNTLHIVENLATATIKRFSGGQRFV